MSRRRIVTVSAPEAPHRAPHGTRLDAIGDVDAGARELRAHAIRRERAKANGRRKRITNVLETLQKRGINPRDYSRSVLRHGFEAACEAQAADHAATLAGAYLWTVGAGKERARARDFILSHAARIVRTNVDFVRDFARNLASVCIDHTLIGDLYALTIEARAIRSGVAPASVLVTNGARVAGSAFQRVWDARTTGSSGGRAKPRVVAVQSRDHALTLNDGGIGGLDADTASEAGQSRSARILTHVRKGDPAVSLGCVDLDDAARIVRLIERDRDTANLGWSRLRNECSPAAWHIAICALRNDGALSRFANAVKRIARAGKASFTMPVKGTAPIASGAPSNDDRVIARCKTRASAMRAFIAARSAGLRPIMRSGDNGVILVITNAVRAQTRRLDTVARDSARADNPPVSGG